MQSLKGSKQGSSEVRIPIAHGQVHSIAQHPNLYSDTRSVEGEFGSMGSLELMGTRANVSQAMVRANGSVRCCGVSPLGTGKADMV